MSTLKNKFNKKNIAVLGLGIENMALVEWLLKHEFDCQLTLCDAKIDLALEPELLSSDNIKLNLGVDYDKELEQYDMVLRIAGYPLSNPKLAKARRAGVEITSPTKLFIEFCPTDNLVGITGTKGKGTTCGFIVEILKQAKEQVYWGGNIGTPMFGFYDDVKPTDWVVLELSSFQLEDLERSPRYAVITNLSPEHLKPADPFNPNFHADFNSYCQSKFNILKWQKRGDWAFVNEKMKADCFPTKRGKLALGRSKKIYFNKTDYPLRLAGDHNLENAGAAVEFARVVGIKDGLVRKALRKFKGLPHRLEFVGEAKGIKYFDDSFATTPESAITALHAFTEPVILLAGGADKGSDFTILAEEIKARVKNLILFEGVGTPALRRSVETIGFPVGNIYSANDMKSAMALARQSAATGDVVLLSPACASFGIFRNYKERGDLFKAEARKLL